MTDKPPAGTVRRLHEFVERYTAWMKEVSTSAANDAAVTVSLVDLMKSRLTAELDRFVEVELRLRVFERRVPEQPPLRRVGTDG
jgi:hypothetical protein